MTLTPIKDQICNYALTLYINSDVKQKYPESPTTRVIDLNILDRLLTHESSDHSTMRARALSIIDTRNLGLNCTRLFLVVATVYQLMFGSTTTIITTIALSLVARNVILNMQKTLTLNTRFYSSIAEMNLFYKQIVSTASNDLNLLLLIEKEFEQRDLIKI